MVDLFAHSLLNTSTGVELENVLTELEDSNLDLGRRTNME